LANKLIKFVNQLLNPQVINTLWEKLKRE